MKYLARLRLADISQYVAILSLIWPYNNIPDQSQVAIFLYPSVQ